MLILGLYDILPVVACRLVIFLFFLSLLLLKKTLLLREAWISWVSFDDLDLGYV